MTSAVRYCNYLAIDFRGNFMSKGKETVNNRLFLRDEPPKTWDLRCVARCPWLGGRYRAPESDQGHPSHDACWNTRHDPELHGTEDRWIGGCGTEERNYVHIERPVPVETPTAVWASTVIGASPDSVRTSASGPHEAAIDATRSAAMRYPPHRRFHADRIFHLPETSSTTFPSAVHAVCQKVKNFTRRL